MSIFLLFCTQNISSAELLSSTKFYAEAQTSETPCAEELARLKADIQNTEKQLNSAAEILQKHQVEWNAVWYRPCPPPIGEDVSEHDACVNSQQLELMHLNEILKADNKKVNDLKATLTDLTQKLQYLESLPMCKP